jgi:hypothetical protein
MANDEQARRERAQRLHEEIDALKTGRVPRKPPASPREFVERQTREQQQTDPEPDRAAESDDG